MCKSCQGMITKMHKTKWHRQKLPCRLAIQSAVSLSSALCLPHKQQTNKILIFCLLCCKKFCVLWVWIWNKKLARERKTFGSPECVFVVIIVSILEHIHKLFILVFSFFLSIVFSVRSAMAGKRTENFQYAKYNLVSCFCLCVRVTRWFSSSNHF